MLRGLNTLTSAESKEEAWRLWDVEADRALKYGRKDLVDNCHPPDGAGWRRIDDLATRLRKQVDLIEDAIDGYPMAATISGLLIEESDLGYDPDDPDQRDFVVGC